MNEGYKLIDFNKFKLPRLTENVGGVVQLTERNYGVTWKPGTTQLYKELYSLKHALYHVKGRKKKFAHKNAFYHCLNVVRILWPDGVPGYKGITIFKQKNGKIIYNSYFLNTLKLLCYDGMKGNDVGLTGPASSAKTFATSVFLLCAFYASPDNTSCLISTTSATASERRIWGDIKSLHRRAKFVGNGLEPIGRIIDYLKALTYMTEDEVSKMEGMKNYSTESSNRSRQKDLRNGLIVIPIPDDSSGDSALDTIMGTKNEHVYWAIDELPTMRNGVLRPRANLIQNSFLKIIGIGNANKQSDPHGVYCRPAVGWTSMELDIDKCITWQAETCTVLCLNGMDSPNDYYEKICGIVEHDVDLPFTYLCNRFGHEYNKKTFGVDSVEYWRFSKGLWIGEQNEQTILSEGIILANGCDQPGVAFRHGSVGLCGFDPGMASGGDANSLMFAVAGYTPEGDRQLTVEPDNVSINPLTKTREEYRKKVAEAVVKECRSRNVQPRNFFMDISADGGLMMKAIMEEWGSTEIVGLSSMEPPSFKGRYKKRVAQYWFQCQLLAQSGALRGFNCKSLYAADLFVRRYESLGSGSIDVEKKADMKKRILRSPDNGDSFTYMLQGAKMRGLVELKDIRQKLYAEKQKREDPTNRIDFYLEGARASTQTDDSLFQYDVSSDNVDAEMFAYD
jgi:hypothetical protein